ncbi:hypothetical protein Tco_0962342 [Tanacetum coccineum]
MLGSGILPSNTITNPKEDLNGITTRSSVTYQGPTIPITTFSPPKVVEHETEVTKDMVPPTNNRSTKDVHPPVVQVQSHVPNSKLVVAPVSASMLNLKSLIPYPSRRNDERCHEKANDQIEKFYEIFKDLSFEISLTDALILMPKFCMRTRSQSRNSNRQQQQVNPTFVEPFNLVEPIENQAPPVVTMDDNRTMAQLLEAPTVGYEDAIVVPEITADNFELKHGLLTLVQNKQFFRHDKEDPHAHIRYFNKITSTMKFPNVPSTSVKLMLFPFSLEGAARIWLEKEPPRSILTWDDLDLPPHLEYAFLEGDNKLPVIIAKDLSVEEKATLIKVLKSHKRAIAWKLSDIKGINP